MKLDSLHYALLAVLVLLVFYAASTYGLFKEHAWSPHPPPRHHAAHHHLPHAAHHQSPNTGTNLRTSWTSLISKK